ncbi:hypothetical protein QAD02_022625 [Eretmocerus hayati]|uniref:Uncharacterized protein n=1 Tax=Eretmocerus hayati TaxID=131215 RepID=A0ACC2PVM7_9HYME|nr:hypothetical protein QAD02_022625 [Eretmocerus hayati]
MSQYSIENIDIASLSTCINRQEIMTEMLSEDGLWQQRRRRRGRPALHARDERDMQYKCPNCPSSFSYLRGLQQHLRYACSTCNLQPKFKCPYCDYRTKYRYNAYHHVRQIHKNEDVYCIELNYDETNTTDSNPTCSQ